MEESASASLGKGFNHRACHDWLLDWGIFANPEGSQRECPNPIGDIEMNCLLRKFILKSINKLLDDYKGNVEAAKGKVWTWMKRSDAINKFLQGLYEKLSDNNLTKEELESALNEFKEMVSRWKSV